MSQQNKALIGLIASALMAIATGMANAGVGSDIYSLLQWVSMGAGAVLIASVIVHSLLQLVRGWEVKVTRVVRQTLVLVLAIGLALGANALLQNPDLIERIEPIYKVVFVTLSVWLAMQVRNSTLKSC